MRTVHPSNPILLEKNIVENLTLSKFSMKAVDDDKIIFYELLPLKEHERLPVVLIFPGSGNQGARDVLDISSEYSEFYYHQGIGKKIAQEGYAVFVIENRGWGERTIDAGSFCGETTEEKVHCTGQVISLWASNSGISMWDLSVADSFQLIKYIKGLDYIDPDNFGVMGLSLGGSFALITSMFDEEISSTIIASGAYSSEKMLIHNRPGILLYFDDSDKLSTIAPRSLYLSWGTEEELPWSYEASTLYTGKEVEKAYQLHGADDNLQIIIHDIEFNSGHTFDISSVIEFLNNTIGPNQKLLN